MARELKARLVQIHYHLLFRCDTLGYGTIVDLEGGEQVTDETIDAARQKAIARFEKTAAQDEARMEDCDAGTRLG